jgi:hypothetical protein
LAAVRLDLAFFLSHRLRNTEVRIYGVFVEGNELI